METVRKWCILGIIASLLVVVGTILAWYMQNSIILIVFVCIEWVIIAIAVATWDDDIGEGARSL